MRTIGLIFLIAVLNPFHSYGQEPDTRLKREQYFRSVPGDTSQFELLEETEFDKNGNAVFHITQNDEDADPDTFLLTYDRKGRYLGSKEKINGELFDYESVRGYGYYEPMTGARSERRAAQGKSGGRKKNTQQVSDNGYARTTEIHRYDKQGREVYWRKTCDRINSTDTFENFQKWRYYESGDSAVEYKRKSVMCGTTVDSVFYDSKGRVTRQVRSDQWIQPIVWRVEDSLAIELTSTGHIEKHYKQHRRPDDKNFRKMVLSYSLVYDTHDSLVSRTDYYYMTSKNSFGDIYEHKWVVSKWEHTRDQFGRREHSEFYKYHVSYSSGCIQNTGMPPTEVYYYDTLGRVIKKVESSSEHHWIYDSAGQLIQEKNFSWNGTLDNLRFYAYDANGNQTEMRYVDISEMVVKKTVCEYY